MKRFLIVIGILTLLLIAFDRLLPTSAARLAIGFERRLAGLSVEHDTSGDFEFSYLTGGEGETLLLIHGFAADKDNFTRVARGLTQRFRVIAVDLPGFGESARLDEVGYGYTDQAARLHAMIQRLGLARFHLGGSSMGGAVALTYAARHPQRVISLWLLAPGGVNGSEDSPMVAEYRATGRSPLVADRADDFRAVLELTMADPPFIPYSLRFALAERAAADAKLHTRIFDEIARAPSVNDAAAGVNVPAFIVWGREDRVLDVSGASILHATLPDSVLNIMDGAGHLPMIEQPGRVARDYIAFIDERIGRSKARLPAAIER